MLSFLIQFLLISFLDFHLILELYKSKENHVAKQSFIPIKRVLDISDCRKELADLQ